MKYRENASEPWKELYIKALDSMPIGTIVDFDGETSDIPVGWEEVGNDYSTTEINTGKTWINGKPIYRKVVIYDSTTALSNGQTNIPHNISNLGTYRNVTDYGFFYQGNMYKGYQSSTFSGEVTSFNDTNIDVSIVGWGNLFKYAYFILEYTKTTD